MILVISTCIDALHEYEFVTPIVDILQDSDVPYTSKHYKDVSEDDLQEASHVIICGTSLQDNAFVSDMGNFDWLKTFDKPVLGICAGMQIISLVFGGSLSDGQEIGFYEEEFSSSFLGLNGAQKVYHLHNKYVTVPEGFTSYVSGEITQAISKGQVFGVLFHPEVRQKDLVKEFVRI